MAAHMMAARNSWLKALKCVDAARYSLVKMSKNFGAKSSTPTETWPLVGEEGRDFGYNSGLRMGTARRGELQEALQPAFDFPLPVQCGETLVFSMHAGYLVSPMSLHIWTVWPVQLRVQ